ncbi:MAG: hypothetical protein LAO05_02485 [Acidobacteriia bacterium]|nr:hypothetical protein [Terriglobia bacterium]
MVVDLRADDWAIGPAPHLGDTYVTCALAEGFLARHGGTRVRVIVPPRLWSVLALFPDAAIEPLDPSELGTPFRETRGFRPGEPFHLRPLRFASDFEATYGGQTIPFTRTYHDLLELPFPAFSRPRVPASAHDAAARRLNDLGLPHGRTAIIVPTSYSAAAFSASFWADLAAALAARGWTVAANVGIHEAGRSIPGTRALPCPAEELIPIAEMAGLVVASRCGVCELISSAHTDLRILYHRPQYDWSPLAGVKLQVDLGACGLEDNAAYYRMGASEPRADFIARIVEGRP